MRNKRGQLFSAILVLITLLMCGLSIMVYSVQQERVQSSLVSPLVVLDVRDNLDIFEMREKELVLKSVESSGIDELAFKAALVSGFNDKMKDFIFSNLTRDGKEMKRGEFDEVSFLDNILYTVQEDSGDIILKRNEVGKSFELRALVLSGVNFTIAFAFNFSAEYLIKKVGSKFTVERI